MPQLVGQSRQKQAEGADVADEPVDRLWNGPRQHGGQVDARQEHHEQEEGDDRRDVHANRDPADGGDIEESRDGKPQTARWGELGSLEPLYSLLALSEVRIDTQAVPRGSAIMTAIKRVGNSCSGYVCAVQVPRSSRATVSW